MPTNETRKKPVTDRRRQQIRKANDKYYAANREKILQHRRARYAAMVAALNALTEGNAIEETSTGTAIVDGNVATSEEANV